MYCWVIGIHLAMELPCSAQLTVPLVSLAAVFRMSRNAPQKKEGGALRDILKTAVRETTVQQADAAL